MGLVEYLLRNQCDITDPCRRIGAKTAPNRATNHYDFIVVGAGVAGPVVASRLSELSEWNVLLLEAGPEEPSMTSVPAFSTSAIGTDLDWNYVTEPSSEACLNNGGRCKWPRGKMVSGTSGMQGMMYTRPHASILDDWGKDNPGWSSKEVLQYYIKSENNLNPELVEPGYHGFSGPMVVQQFPSRPPLADVVVEAGTQLGYTNGDLNGHNQTGVGIAQMMVYEGLRASTARMYLRPFLDTRGNLKIAVNSQVTKVLIDPDTKIARGVQYIDQAGNTQTVYALKEVILSAGAINSPHLLLLSGVGPSQDLEAVGINTIVDLPGVGQNLQNHVAASIGFYMNESATDSLTLESLKEFIETRTGNMASTGLTQTTLLMTSKYAKDGVPDLQLFFNGYSAKCSKSGAAEECENTGKLQNCPNRRLLARPTLIIPESRGYLKLNTSDPLDYPLLYPPYLQTQRDVDILVDGLKLSIKVANTPALQKYGLTLDTTPVQGCESYEFGSDEYFVCSVRRATGAENHQGGATKMGPAEDNMAVVDHQLRVHGVKNIRVVDPSIFPTLPNCNPTSVIIMAAEKASDLIKKAWEGEARDRTV